MCSWIIGVAALVSILCTWRQLRLRFRSMALLVSLPGSGDCSAHGQLAYGCAYGDGSGCLVVAAVFATPCRSSADAAHPHLLVAPSRMVSPLRAVRNGQFGVTCAKTLGAAPITVPLFAASGYLRGTPGRRPNNRAAVCSSGLAA